MFRKNPTFTQSDLFTGLDQILGEKKMKILQDQKAWYNIFKTKVYEKIDESTFSVLYSNENGRPNASIRRSISMMIMKEGMGWSDAELYEKCAFDFTIVVALGLSNATDEVPAASTYYELRKKIYEHELETGINLMAETHSKTAKAQAEIFDVNAKWIRMDSKLVGSNIAKCSRLQLIINCIQEFYKSLEDVQKYKLQEEDRNTLEELINKKAHQIVYRLEEKQKTEYLEKYGLLLSRLLELYNRVKDNETKGPNNKYPLIERLFNEQYKRDSSGQIVAKDVKEMNGDILQSPYDEDAGYKNKDGKGVKGYSMNLTETCNKDTLNLITGVEIKKATAGDPEFFQEALEQAEEICGKVEAVSVDGAYHNQENQQFVKEKGIKLYLGGLPGNDGDYEFEIGEQIKVKNKKTGEEMIASITPKGHFRIKESNGKVRYFKKKQIENYNTRKQIETIPKEIRNVRCNVEASIFQSCFHLRKDKTKYRGRSKTQSWANSRAMWVNFKRICKYMVKKDNLAYN